MTDFVLTQGDKAVFIPAFGAAVVTPLPGILKGSGKTTIADIFDTLGIPTYNADNQAKKLMNTDTDLIIKIKNLFGDQAYAANQLDRKYIANKVFNDNSLLEQLNQLVHPKVFEDLASWFEQRDTKYALYESALIYQGNAHKYLDKVIYVYASSVERIRRIMDRCMMWPPYLL